MANDGSKMFFNVLALENILVALTREIGDGPCFLYIEFSWIGVRTLFPYKPDPMPNFFRHTLMSRIQNLGLF